ncbi:bifunctional endoribonuclease/protein kinase ire1, partial [Tulasnella sp. 427]
MASSSAVVYILSSILFLAWKASASHEQLQANQEPLSTSFKEPLLKTEDVKLLDIVLLASVNGRFHALNRTTGSTIWSTEQPAAEPHGADTGLRELVRTDHGNLRSGHLADGFGDEVFGTETYIVEPQSGVVFVSLADRRRDEPLQKLPFTMRQLVDMSPVHINHRTFVGKKQTSRITLDLASGELVDIANGKWGSSRGDQPGRALIYIDRTDYEVAVYRDNQAIQNVVYSSYGPNNIDKEMQYHLPQTRDSWYHQPTPDGSLLLFKIDETEPLKSFIKLRRSIVAVFDTFSIGAQFDAFLVEQPKPALVDLCPSRIRRLMASSLVAAYLIPLILFFAWSATSHPPAHNAATSITALQQFQASQHQPRISFKDPSLEADELKLMDVVLLASVDGRFHALNRTTGRMIWSMEQPIANPQVAATNLKELVRTEHAGLRTTSEYSLDDYDDDPAGTETYIIEPQSGAIFVSPTDSKRDDPLQKLPFTMQQLVDMSPLRIEHRTFVGKKRTSLITLDLASGELVEVLDPEQQCSWGDHPTRKRFFQSKDEDLLDELDPPGADRTLVHVGRTEYHVSVYLHDHVIQNLTYSSYGPNNIDKELQYHWRRTPDNLYHQPTPDGSLLMFKIDEKEPFHSFIKLKRPIVAVFDTISIADRSDALILAQPTPALNDLYPSRLKELRELSKQDEVTWVGRVGNSLYALSHNTFPLVIFSQIPRVPTIDSEHGEAREVLDTDDLGTTLDRVCTTLDCHTGPHRTETATMSRLSRLIAGADSDPGRTVMPRYNRNDDDDDDFEEEDRPTSSSPPVVITTPRQSNPPRYPALDPPRTGDQLGRWTIGGADLKNPIFTGLFGLIFLAWVFAKRVTETWRKSQGSSEVIERDMGFEKPAFPRSRPVSVIETPVPQTMEEVVQAVVPPEIMDSKPLPPVPAPENVIDLGEPEVENVGDKTVIVEEPEGDNNGEDPETEKEVEETKGSKSKKKGATRRKRGKG